MVDTFGPLEFCSANIGVLNPDDRKTFQRIVKELEKEAKETAENPNDLAEVNQIFFDLVENQRKNDLSQASRRRIEARSLLEARARRRRGMNALMNSQRTTLKGKPRFSPRMALVEELNRVGNEVVFNEGKVFQSFMFELEKQELSGFFRDNANARNILLEIGERNKKQGSQPGITGSTQAQEVARIYQQTIDSQRAIMGDNGVIIGDLEERMVRNTLTPESLKKKGKQQFVEDFLHRVDREKTFGQADLSDGKTRVKLAKLYDTITKGDMRDVPLTQRGSGARADSRLADSLTQSREVHLSGVDDVQFMVEQYGPGAVKNIMIDTVRSNARNAALVKEMGPDPRNTLESMKQYAKRNSTDEDEISKVDEPDAQDRMMGRDPDAILDTVDGTAFRGDTSFMRDLGIITRNVASFALLGKLFFASVPDLGSFRRAQDRVGMEVGGQMAGFVDQIFQNSRLSEQQQRQALGHIGLASRFMIHDMYEMSTNGSFSGKVANYSQYLGHFTFKYSGGEFWQKTMQRVAQASFAKHMADETRAGKRFGDLEGEMQDVLLRAGVTEEDWDTLSRLQNQVIFREQMDGNDVLMPETVRDLSDETVRNEILGRPDASDRVVRNAREEFTSKMQNALFTFTNEAVLRPDARVQSALALGTQAGTVTGFLLRSMTNLLSWPYAFTMRALGREFNNSASLMGGLAGAGTLQATMMFYAGIGLAAQDILTENKVRDWTSTENAGRNFLDLASRGGAGGIFGGWALDAFRYNSPPFALGGPAASVIGGALRETTGSLKDLSQGEIDDAGARLVRASEEVLPDLPIFQPLFMGGVGNWAEKEINPRFEAIDEDAGFRPLIDTQ
jgi:hypothetical protein